VNGLVRLVAATTVVGLVTSGCGVLSGGLRGVDLPGGADLGDHPYSVTIEFADVVDLVPQSLVKVDDVPVGAVSSIAVDPATWNARVTVDLNGDVTLPANASARVRTTSLLGEKFVELAAPEQGSTGTRSRAPDGRPRSRRSSARCRCCSTEVVSPRSGPSRPSSTTRSKATSRRSARYWRT
jgi:virulence factor Mce-like protein